MPKQPSDPSGVPQPSSLNSGKERFSETAKIELIMAWLLSLHLKAPMIAVAEDIELRIRDYAKHLSKLLGISVFNEETQIKAALKFDQFPPFADLVEFLRPEEYVLTTFGALPKLSLEQDTNPLFHETAVAIRQNLSITATSTDFDMAHRLLAKWCNNPHSRGLDGVRRILAEIIDIPNAEPAYKRIPFLGDNHIVTHVEARLDERKRLGPNPNVRK